MEEDSKYRCNYRVYSSNEMLSYNLKKYLWVVYKNSGSLAFNCRPFKSQKKLFAQTSLNHSSIQILMLRATVNIVFLLLATSTFGQSYNIEKLNPAINSMNYDEISPRVSPDGKTLFFTRLGYPVYDKTLLINGRNWGQTSAYQSKLKSIYQLLGGKRSVHPENSSFNQDIWSATHNIGLFDRIHHVEYPLNNALPNSVCSFSADGQSIYVINKFDRAGGMEPGFSKSTLQGMNWSFPEPLKIGDFYTKSDGIHMSMSEDEKIIVMSLMRDDSHGGTDLYVSFRQGHNKYSVPVNLGPDVNTEHNEEAPYICSDNKTLYFSSDRPGEYGGKDLYKAVRLDVTWNTWEQPYAFPKPINSHREDNQPFYHSGTGYLYFVSSRDVSGDIFRTSYVETLQEKDPENTVYAAYDPEPESQPQYSYFPSSAPVRRSINLKVINSKTGAPLSAQVKYVSRGKTGNTVAVNGQTSMTFDEGDVWVSVSLDGFITHEVLISSDEVIRMANDGHPYIANLDEMVVNGKIYVDPIFFEQSTATVKERSYPALNKLVRTLAKHWKISITVEGHTDDQGSPDQLIALSEKRAKAIKSYLVSKGIAPLRVDAVGVGDQKPLNDNSTDALRQQNRRVEVIISKIYES